MSLFLLIGSFFFRVSIVPAFCFLFLEMLPHIGFPILWKLVPFSRPFKTRSPGSSQPRPPALFSSWPSLTWQASAPASEVLNIKFGPRGIAETRRTPVSFELLNGPANGPPFVWSDQPPTSDTNRLVGDSSDQYPSLAQLPGWEEQTTCLKNREVPWRELLSPLALNEDTAAKVQTLTVPQNAHRQIHKNGMTHKPPLVLIIPRAKKRFSLQKRPAGTS